MQDFVGHSRISTGDAFSRERQRIEKMARRLYSLAWTIEAVAVALGLGMALSQNIAGQSNLSEFLLGGGGFVMVSCAELAKIPLATFMVETPTLRAKLGTFVFLCLMSFITFETILMSLERGFDARLRLVQAARETVEKLEADHARLVRLIQNPGADLESTRATIQSEQSEIDKAFRIEFDSIAQERNAIRSQLHEVAWPRELDEQRKALEKRRAMLGEDRDKKIEAAHKRAMDAIEVLHKELRAARKASDPDRVRDIEKKIDQVKSSSERRKIENDHQREIAKIDAQAKKLLEERADIVRISEEAAKPRLDELVNKETNLRRSYDVKREDLRRRLDALHNIEARKVSDIAALTEKRDGVDVHLKSARETLRSRASESQLHRISPAVAGWWAGQQYEAHTIPDAVVKKISMIWFGSMAALGAIGGSVVAMISQLLWKRADRLEIDGLERGGDRDKFLATIRRLLLTWRYARPRTKTVEVVKTETKTETKIVAVPVPVAVSGTHNDFDKLKREYEMISGSLTEATRSALASKD